MRKTTHEDAEASAQSHANAELQDEERLKEARKKDDAASETRRRGWNLQGGKHAAEALWEANPGKAHFSHEEPKRKRKRRRKRINYFFVVPFFQVHAVEKKNSFFFKYTRRSPR